LPKRGCNFCDKIASSMKDEDSGGGEGGNSETKKDRDPRGVLSELDRVSHLEVQAKPGLKEILHSRGKSICQNRLPHMVRGGESLDAPIIGKEKKIRKGDKPRQREES